MSLTYRISGKVVRGNQLGRQLGFPTANLLLEQNHPVKDGVYAVHARVDGACLNGMASIGTRPTVTDAPERFLEVNLFDFNGDIYGKTIEVELVAFIRMEQKFASLEALCRQIEQDEQDAKRIITEAGN